VGIIQQLRDGRFARRVDGASLAVFRFGFGSIVAWEVWRAFDGNLIRADYELPKFHFTWWGFGWVDPLPGVWLYVAFAALGAAAFCLAIGLFTRVAAALTCLGLTYWILMEKAAYLNHRYLAALLALLFAVVPAGAVWSVDARRRRGADATVPGWSVDLIRFQVGVPYFFAGVAKLNFDWLFRAEPLATGLKGNADVPLIGSYLTNDALAHVLAWGSAALDLFVPFLLLHRRTRTIAFGFALTFHMINSRLFDIGMFPWMMIVGTTVFFEPDWPRRLLATLRTNGSRRVAIIGGFIVGFILGGIVPDTFAVIRALCGGFGVAVLAFHAAVREPVGSPTLAAPAARIGRPVAVFLAAWLAVQLLLPVRHFFIPGNVHWTEEGNRFAWHMLLRVTRAHVVFIVTDVDTKESFDAELSNHLTEYQIGKVRYPDLMLEFAHHLRDYYDDVQGRDVEVRVKAAATLNGRPVQWLVRGDTVLSEVERPYPMHADWLEPLEPYDESGRERGG
jgi:vitamin K-dependent gamma-carboxylase